MSETKQEKEWRREFEREGEAAIRDSINFSGGITYDAVKLQFARNWLRGEERRRHRRDSYTFCVAVATLGVAVLTLFAAIAAILH